VAICAVIDGNARKPGVGRLTVEHCLPASLRRQQIATAAIHSIGAVFFIDARCKRPHELTMDSSHHARRIRARARRLSAGAWDMRMH
jgi:hypothetical protein